MIERYVSPSAAHTNTRPLGHERQHLGELYFVPGRQIKLAPSARLKMAMGRHKHVSELVLPLVDLARRNRLVSKLIFAHEALHAPASSRLVPVLEQSDLESEEASPKLLSSRKRKAEYPVGDVVFSLVILFSRYQGGYL